MDFDDEIIRQVKASGFSESSFQQLESLILSKDDETILNHLDKRSRGLDSGQAIIDYIRAMFSILGRSAREDQLSRPARLLLFLAMKCLTLFQAKIVNNDRKCIDCFDFIVQEMDVLPKPLLPSITEFICVNVDSIDGPDDGHELRLLPRALRFIFLTPEVKVPGQDGDEMVSTGSEYAGFVIKRILHAKWSNTMLTRMVSLLREMQLDRSHVEEFLKKIFGCMKRVDPQDLPSLVYQLLLFASKGLHKKLVLGGIVNLFGEVLCRISEENPVIKRPGVKKSSEVLRQVEGTVLLHMNFAIKQDPSLGQELLNLVRVDHRPIAPFTVALLLSIARIQRFEEVSMVFLRTLMVKSHQDYKQARDCSWIPDDLRLQSLQIAKAVEEALLQAVQYSSFGRDHIIPSVVKIGFALLEFVEAGKMCFAADSVSCNGLVGVKELGVQALKTAFEIHDMARNEIIEQIKIRIISLKPAQSSVVIRLLGELVQSYPHLMLEHVARLKESLDYFTLLNFITSSSFIKSLCPLFQMSRDLQNYTVLVLRKAIFGREETSRVAATRAIIDLIISEKQMANSDLDSFPTSSQASCSQQTKFARGLGLNLFQELKGLLRRCLLQQARVKEAMYKGLVKLVLVDPAAAGPVFDLLWPHFLQYCVPQEDGGLQLKLSTCVKVRNGIICLEEPLDYLLSCVHHLLVLQPQNKTVQQSEYSMTCFGFSLSQDNEGGGVSSGESFANAFLNLRQSFRRGKLEGYSLDKTQNFNPETSEGERNIEQACVMLGILEVLLDISVSELRNATDANREENKTDLMSLIELYDSLEQSACRKQGNVARKGSMKAPSDPKAQTQETGNQSHSLRHSSNAFSSSCSQDRVPFLMTSNIAHLLEASMKLMNTNISSSQPTSNHRSQGTSGKQIIHHFKLVSFALKSCLRHLKLMLIESFEQTESQNPFKVLVDNEMKILGGSLLQIICLLKSTLSSIPTQDKPKNKETKGKKASDEAAEGLIHTAILCMDILCKLSFTKHDFTDILEEMLSVPSSEADSLHERNIEMEDIPEIENESPETRLVHQFLWRKIHPLLVQFLSLSHFRVFEVLTGTALFLGGKLPLHLRKLHGTWAEMTCRSMKVMHNGAARALATLALYLSIPPLDLTIGQRMASELLKVMGSEERDPIDLSDVYVTINASTSNGIATLLLQLAEATLVDVDWLISKLKASLVAGNLPLLDANTDNQRRANVSRAILEETLHTRVESLVHMLSLFTEMSLRTSPAEHFLRVASKLYKSLAAVTKLCIAPKGYKQPLPSSKFQMLAEVTCRKMTAPLYNFMAVMQRDQQENSQEKGVVNKIKRECKTIPNLIFYIEDYEKYLIQLSKLTKVNLLRHAKRSTARDFKIIDTGKKKKEDENNQPEEPNQSDAPVTENVSEDETLRQEEEGILDVPSEGNVVDDECKSDSENDLEENTNNGRKRKITHVIQDSDEE
ncbi:hypothetical protein SUGI_0135980 [Cryptomeria japonica]|uniref:uncharacterized protein LOC131044666 n=1 Tax=Cryptomeria japonica TaxID=3369 RepID=UPI002408A84B|nr:uncharacterized protein LOC131044666 [Cryptomeria japonica]GLJ10827.1 hypothetical protein SUGI_0135980 [Cryptomeria japonica]